MIENRFTKAIEQDIEKYLDTLSFDSLNHYDLLSPELKRAKMKYEILESVEHSEFNQQIQLAFVILKNEGAEFLSQEEYEEMSNNLASAATILAAIDANKEIIINYKEILGISDRTIEACSTMANAKFNAELYSDALALSLLMVIFVPNNAFYLYRVGLSAQNAKKYDFAIKSYSAAVEIYPEFYEALLFTTLCFISQSLYTEATDTYAKAKEIIAKTTIEKPWQQLYQNIEEILQAPR